MAGSSAAVRAETIKKERSSGFPSISLPEAAAIIKTAGKYGKQHPLLAMAGYAGHKTDNSGPFRQKLAALKDWGFVTVNDGLAVLTPAAIGIAHPTSSEEEAELMVQAFQGCDVFWGIYADLGKGVVLDSVAIANKAVATYDISAKAKEKFATSFIHSAVAIGLAKSLNDHEIELVDVQSQDDGYEQESKSELTEVNKPVVLPQPSTSVYNQPFTAPAVTQVWQGEHLSITLEIRADRPLPAGVFAEVGRAVQALEDAWAAAQD